MTLAKGSGILSEYPFAHVLYPKYARSKCDNCFSKKNLKACDYCHTILYCCGDCAVESNEIHRLECPLLGSIENLPSSLWLTARLYFKLGQRVIDDGQTGGRTFKDLDSHLSEYESNRKEHNRREHAYRYFKNFIAIRKLPRKEEFVEIYGKVCANSLEIKDEWGAEIGLGIYLNASAIDHSCVPNSICTFEGKQLNVYSVKDIPDFELSKVRVSYIQPMRCYRTRKKLLSSYLIKCDCERCTGGRHRDMEISMRCPREACGRPISSSTLKEEPDISNAKTIVCNWCGEMVDFFKCTTFKRIEHLTLSLLKNEHAIIKPSLADFRDCLNSQRSLFHYSNNLRLETLLKTLARAVETGEGVGQACDVLEKDTSHYYWADDPALGLFYIRVGSILTEGCHFKEADVFYRKAKIILGLPDHLFNPIC